MTDISLPVFGQLAWIDVVLVVWFTATVASVAYVAFDAFTKNPEMTVMKWGWVLVTLARVARYPQAMCRPLSRG